MRDSEPTRGKCLVKWVSPRHEHYRDANGQPETKNTYLCLDVTFRQRDFNGENGPEDPWYRVKRRREEVSTVLGNESGGYKPPTCSCLLHLGSCEEA